MNESSRDLYPSQFPDSWACAWGEDHHGLWAAFEVEGIQQRMRWIAPGVYMMGDELTGSEKETVSVKGFWLADTACTQALYSAVIGDNPSGHKGDQNPVETVSFKDIQRIVEAINGKVERLRCRLPTENEWEYACRAGTNSLYWFGDTIDNSQARFDWIDDQEAELNGTVEVAHYDSNAWGLYQMHGNVWEWCQDWYDADVELRVVRGGSWFNFAEDLRSGLRYGASPNGRNDNLGFRLARGQ